MTVKKKMIWTMVSGLMALSLVLVSCGQAEVEETKGPGITVTTEEKEQEEQKQAQEEEKVEEEEVVGPSGPQYGGTLTVIAAQEPQVRLESRSWPAYEQFMGLDWTRGPSGSGVANFPAGGASIEDNSMPMLMESWETPEQGVWIMQVRQGVHWQQTGTEAGNMMGGREVTADDIVDSFNWQLHESGNQGWIHRGQPAVAAASTIEKTGPWEVTVRTPIDFLTSWTWIIWGAGYHHVLPVAVGKAFDHQLEFRNNDVHFSEVVGTGPFIVDDVVAASSRTWRKNPNYWMTDPVGSGEGNQLPYLDGIMELWLPDRSTQLAAFRTGKVGFMNNLTKDDWDTESNRYPELKSFQYLNQTTQTRFIMMDTRKEPFSDIRVRQALMMATDFEAFRDDYYSGAAEIDVWPLNSNFAASGYIPLDETPQEIQDLYSYNPDRAKELLTEAGYPDGFKVTILLPNIGTDADEVVIYKDMWSKVGIDLELEVIENLAFINRWNARDYGDMVYRYMWTTWPMMFYFSSDRGPSTNNLSFINDPIGADVTVEQAFQDVNADMIVNMEGVYQTMRDLRLYMMEQAHVIPRPTPYLYNAWQPWLNNFGGIWSTDNAMQYYWIDQELKKDMGH